MKQRSAFARRSIRMAGLGGALLLTSLGLQITPAGATTTALVPGSTSPFTNVSYSYTDDGCGTFAADDTDETPDQTFVAGPATPPSGTGSLKFAIDTVGEQQLLRTAAYNDIPLGDFDALSYSTYIETAGKQAPYLRLSVDTNGDGTFAPTQDDPYTAGDDTSLFFYPANNAAQNAYATGVWQTWNVATGTLNHDGDPGGGTTTLAAFATANPDAVIVNSFTPGADPNEAGGFTIAQGCGGANTSGSVSFVDEIVIDLADKAVAKYDLEATAPARTMTLSTTAGMRGSSFNVSGTDCFESTVTALMGESNGQSGNELARATATPAADGTWSTSITIPSSADPQANHNVFAICGPEADPAFSYASQTFEVAGRQTGGNGYRMVAADGGIFTFGARNFHGSTGNLTLNKPIVGGATDISDYDGYWIVASDGGIFTFNAEFYGSLGDNTLTSPAVEIEPTPSGLGYWIVQADGTVTPFGDAKSFGDMKGKALNKPMIGMSVTPSGQGYWLVAEDGGIFNFGDADFFGSTGSMKLNAPIIDLAPAVDNNGYYLLGRDGGVFTFGSAEFKGSTGSMTLNAPVVAMLVAPTGAGYWLAASDGGIFTFGAVEFLGSMGGTKLNSPVLDLIN